MNEIRVKECEKVSREVVKITHTTFSGRDTTFKKCTKNMNFATNLISRWRIFILQSAYQPGCEIWNLLPKTSELFLRVPRHYLGLIRNFSRIFSHFWAIFSYFIAHFVYFEAKLKSSQLLTVR